MKSIDKAIARLEQELRAAEEVERTDKRNGSPVQSTAYDAGRVAGLRDALSVLYSMAVE